MTPEIGRELNPTPSSSILVVCSCLNQGEWVSSLANFQHELDYVLEHRTRKKQTLLRWRQPVPKVTGKNTAPFLIHSIQKSGDLCGDLNGWRRMDDAEVKRQSYSITHTHTHTLINEYQSINKLNFTR